MAKKEKSKKKKIFRLVILDNESLTEHFSLILSKLNIFAYGGALFILIAAITIILLIFTPLNFILPNQDNIKLNTLVAKNVMLIDSLEKEIVFRDNYFQNIQNILSDKNIEQFKADTSQTNIISQTEKDSIIKQLLAQQNDLINEIDKEDDLSINQSIFVKPIEGTISKSFSVSKEHFGIDIKSKPNAQILSAIKGTVTIASLSVNSEYIIQIQSGNIVTVYKKCSELLKKEGDKVDAGEPIAIIGKGDNSAEPILHFEIWEGGEPVNPVKYLKF